MDIVGLLLIVGGVAAIAVGALRIRGPLATIRRLDQTEANLARYETWRGRRTGVDADGPTGADVMRAQMRQHVLLWSAVIGAGVVAILLGLVTS
jgi:hypothetical protein